MYHCKRLHAAALQCGWGTLTQAQHAQLVLSPKHPPHCSLPTWQLASYTPALPAVLLLDVAAATLTAAAAAAAGWGRALQDVHCATGGANCQHLAVLWVAPG
jgi:hypothetical protein